MHNKIDALVAENVFGHKISWLYGTPGVAEDDAGSAGIMGMFLPTKPYSNYIGYAFEIVSHLKHTEFSLNHMVDGRWEAIFEGTGRTDPYNDKFIAEANTAQMAIALCALKVYGIEVD